VSAAIVVRGPGRVSGTLPRPEAAITRLNDYTIQLPEGDVTVRPGQLFVMPRGVQHCPIADGEVQAMLIEPAGVTNTGDAGGPLTAPHDDSLR